MATAITAFIALGSNLGKRQTALRTAINHIGRLPNTVVTAVASFRETDPVEAPAGSPRFINTVIQVETTLSSIVLLQQLLHIEKVLGRERTIQNAPRVIDLDLLLYANEIHSQQPPVLPHPRMHLRRFVLEPLAEIAPHVAHPTLGKTMRQLLDALPAEPQGAAR